VIRKLIYLTFAALMLTGVVIAQDVSVRSDHPEEYVVVKGDTLWDISGRFLDKPWQWPAIWHANPQIENPHLIYPGDVISLVYVDGVPQLRLRRGGTEKLSPSIRVADRDAIRAVPFESIAPFIRNLRVLSPEEFAGLPYIVANEDQRLTSTYSDVTYARGLDAQVGEEYIVARVLSIYDSIGDPAETRRVNPRPGWQQVPAVWDRDKEHFNPWSPWDRGPKNPIGYEMLEVSRVRVAKIERGISVLDIIRDRTEVRPGDYILPANDPGYDSVFYPQAMDSVPEGLRVLATSGQKAGVGLYQIVSISGGSRMGIKPGHVFSAFDEGAVVTDRTGYRYGSFARDAEVQLPDVYDGLVMVFRTFEDISYGLVMSGSRVVEEFDVLKHPDERM
jgi:hypothetical protein